MKRSSRIALKFYLQNAPGLEKFLSPQEREKLAEVPASIDFQEDLLLDTTHWSWFYPTLKVLGEEEQKLFITALPESISKHLLSSLDLLKAQITLPQIGRDFLRKTLLHSIIDPYNPPLSLKALPDTRTAALLKLPKKKLVELIDKLAMYDLAEALRQIVDTKLLKKIHSFLTPSQEKLLKKCAAYREAFSLSKLNLDRWDGTEEAFRSLLHKRGLMRFSAAVSGESPDFLWHLCHQLDIGRGTSLHKWTEKPSPKPVQEAILRQIYELL